MSGGSHGRCIMKLMELKLQGLLMCIGYFMALFLIKKKKKNFMHIEVQLMNFLNIPT